MSENDIKLAHSGLNGHIVNCACDLCNTGDEIGFYTCTCSECDPTSKWLAYDSCCDRHDIICDCGQVSTECQRYQHIIPEPFKPRNAPLCDCRDCRYDPIFACDSGCPICFIDLFAAHMRTRYYGESQNIEPLIVATRESSMFTYQILQWAAPVGSTQARTIETYTFVIATPTTPPFVPAVETLVLDVAEAHKEIREQIAAEPQCQKLRRWSDIPKHLHTIDVPLSHNQDTMWEDWGLGI